MKTIISGKSSSVPSGIMIGALLAMGITVIGSAIIAKMVDLGYIQQRNVGYGIMVMLVAASYAGVTISCKRIRRRFLMTALLTAIVYWLFLLGITALFFGGQYDAILETGLLIVCGSVIALLSIIGHKKSTKKYKIK